MTREGDLDALTHQNRQLTEQVRRLIKTEQRLHAVKNQSRLQLKRIGALNQFALSAATAGHTHEVLSTALRFILSSFSFEHVAAFLREMGGRVTPVLTVVRGGVPVPTEAGQWDAEPLGSGWPVGPVILPGNRGGGVYPGLDPFVRYATAAFESSLPRLGRPESRLVIPCWRSSHELLGVLIFQRSNTPLSHADSLPGEQELPFLALCARHIEAALENVMLRELSVESEERFARGFETSIVGMLMLDRRGRVLRANDAAAAIAGVTAQVLAGRPFKELIAVDPYAHGELARLGADPMWQSSSFLAEIERSPEVVRTVQVSISRLMAHGSEYAYAQLVDVTARQKAEAELKASARRLREVIEHLPTAIFVVRSGRIEYVNSAAVRLLGTASVNEIAGSDLRSYVHPEEEAPLLTAVQSVEDHGVATRVLERSWRRANGTEFVAEETLVPISFEGAAAVLILVDDVTERRHMKTQLIQADRLATVGALAAGVAHEINNPLSYVMLHLERLTRRLSDGADQQGAASALEGAVRIRDIVRDLRTFSRVDEGGRTAVDVHAVLETVLAMAANEMKYRAKVVRDYCDPCRVLVNEGRLAQVFLNLVVNAVQAIEEGDLESNSIRLATRRDGDNVIVTVSDTGVGIASQDLPRIFEPFFTTKAPGVGSGLGLSICRNLIEGYGGRITVASEVSRGTSFAVSLPTTDEAAPRSREGVRRESISNRRGRILLIDDEDQIRMVLAEFLGADHDVVTAADGVAAQQILAADTSFDVVVCDLMMPGVSGVDLYAWVCEHCDGLSERMVFMTGGAFTPKGREFLEQLSRPVLDKPFPPAKLLRLVGQYVGRA